MLHFKSVAQLKFTTSFNIQINMQIIASSIYNKSSLSKKQWIGYGIIGIVIFSACIMLFHIGGGIPALLCMLFYLTAIGRLAYRDFYNSKTHFVAFTENDFLVIDFEEQENDNNLRHANLIRHRKEYFKLSELTGYTLHSFFKMPPAFIELQSIEVAGFVKQTLIPLEALPNNERKKLIAFIEHLLPNKLQKVTMAKPSKMIR